jgi:predicted HicB family RNase H-like nuclease
MIEYKGYVGLFEFDERSSLFLGKVVNIDTLVTFQGKSIKEVKQGFQVAIDDYLEWCKRHAKEPEKPSTKVKDSFKEGVFKVSVPTPKEMKPDVYKIPIQKS